MKKYLSRFVAALLALALLAVPASALTVDEALELLEENYYYDIPDEAYGARTLGELFQILGDPYTQYMTREEYALFLELVEDTVDMVGIGVEISYTQEGILIKKVLTGGSAEEAGLQAGDLIVAIGGTPCAPAGEEHRQLMLGEAGTRVTIIVLRDGQAGDYTLTRRAVYIPNTEITLLEGDVGYVDCNSFGLDTDELFADGLKQYDAQVDYWIVDLRDNVGGYMDTAKEMLAAVNGPGSYCYLEDSSGRVYGYVCRSAAVTSKPLILLVNGESASASEMFASGVRDMDRGVVIGSRTYGKGVAQVALDGDTDPDYFDGDCLKITSSRFYAAGGSTTDKIGVIPTLLVEDGYTQAVAAALTGGSETASSLCVMAGSRLFYVNPETPDDVLCVLLESLAPHTLVFYKESGVFGQCTPAQAAAGSHRGDLYEMLYPTGTELDWDAQYDRPFTFTYVRQPRGPDDQRIETENPSKTGSLLMYRDSFGNDLYPLMAEDSEFAHKWVTLCKAHMDSGITDPIKAYEYMHTFYVVEGHKRVSVLRWFGAVSIPAPRA